MCAHISQYTVAIGKPVLAPVFYKCILRLRAESRCAQHSPLYCDICATMAIRRSLTVLGWRYVFCAGGLADWGRTACNPHFRRTLPAPGSQVPLFTRDPSPAVASEQCDGATWRSRLRALFYGESGASTIAAATLVSHPAGPVTSASTVASSSAPLVGAGLAKFLAVAPPTCFFFLQTSPYVCAHMQHQARPQPHCRHSLKTMKDIIKNESTGNLNPLPFVSLAANCVVWTLYGVLQSDMTVLLPNATGMCFGLAYTAVFAKYNAGL